MPILAFCKVSKILRMECKRILHLLINGHLKHSSGIIRDYNLLLGFDLIFSLALIRLDSWYLDSNKFVK